MNEPAVNEYTGFELYIEGVKIPTFNSITIRETEGAFPQASISFPASSGILRVLPGTIVQIFGPDPKEDKKILLFEGEIISKSFGKSPSGKNISFQCQSFLQNWKTATTIPADSIMTPQWRAALGGKETKFENVTEKSKDTITPLALNQIEEKLRERISMEAFGSIEEKLEDDTFTQMGQFADELTKQLQDEGVQKGDIYLLVLFFLKKFELGDPYYGMVASSINLSKSVSVWPNKGKIDPFKTKAVLENVFKLGRSIQQGFQKGALNLMKGVQRILEILHYTVVAPTNATSSLHFWSNDSERAVKESPTRCYFMPNLEQSPPALFNLIFDHQINNLSYNRNFQSEPTRTLGTVETSYPNGNVGDTAPGLELFCTEPMLNITDEGIKKNSAGMTPEETYRGITPNFDSFNRFFLEAGREDLENSKKENPAEEYRDHVKKSLNQMTLAKHHQKRLSSRSVNVSTSWLPYLMTGVPGAVIDPEDTPSITGVISAVTTSISGSGNASCTITMRAPRLIYDLEELEGPNVENMLHDFTLDPYINSNEQLFDPKIYDYENIGYDLYTYLRWGTLNSNSERGGIVKEYAENDGIFSEGKSSIQKIHKKELTRDGDNSIISMIRDEEGVKKPKISMDLFDKGNKDSDYQKSEVYTRDVYESIKNIEQVYKGIESGKDLEKWSRDFTYRKIISKGDYFAYIGIDPTQPIDREENYKDTIKLFSGTTSSERVKTMVENEEKEVVIDNASERQELINYREHLQIRIDSLQKERMQQDTTAERKSEIMKILTRGTQAEKALYQLWMDVNDLLNPEEKSTMEDYNMDSSIPPGFAKDLFKVYNLTRGAHVKVGFQKLIAKALKSSNLMITK